jgi:hypothetical protein
MSGSQTRGEGAAGSRVLGRRGTCDRAVNLNIDKQASAFSVKFIIFPTGLPDIDVYSWPFSGSS